MSTEKFKLFVLCILCFIQITHWESAYGENETQKSTQDPRKKDLHQNENPEQGSQKKIKPLPRHILLPTITYARSPDIEGENTVDLSKHTYWFITVLASWNQRSADINRIMNSHASEFQKKNIGVFILFSQNSKEDVEEWRLKNKPAFENYFASRNFMDNVQNPKIPLIWLVGSQGEILAKLEMPTLQQIDTIIQKSFILTGF